MNHDFTYIDTPDEFNRLLETLQEAPIIAVDTESDSLYSYFEKVCLVQISTETADYIIDSLALDITPLGDILANPQTEIIFHAAEYDLLGLRRDFGITVGNLFDTMISARILGWKKFGLGNILLEQFDVESNKKYQRYNWGNRPLSTEALTYANLDTHYLIPLRNLQRRQLQAANRFSEAEAAFNRLLAAKPKPKYFDPADFWHIQGSKQLLPRQQALLQALYVLREDYARSVDMPAFKIASSNRLMQLVHVHPGSAADLKGIKGFNGRFLRTQANKILKIFRATYTEPIPYKKVANPRQKRLNASGSNRYESLRTWRNTTAEARGVESDVILTNHALMGIAKANPKTLSQLEETHLLGDWQLETYGLALLEALKKRGKK